MENLLINIVGAGDNESWMAMVSNTPVTFTFDGVGLSQQAEQVYNLAMAMRQGQAAVLDQITDLFVFGPESGATPEELAGALFQDTGELFYGDAVEAIFVAEEGAVLWDVIAEAGTALMGAIAA